MNDTRITLRHKTLAVAVAACFTALPAHAVPSNPTVVSGSATFSTSGSTLTVTNTPKAIINWQSFSIDAGETVRFVQQSASSAVLNRVTGADPSHILGALQSNGKVFLINPNGILFGAGARIDVNGLVASTLDITDADFLSGRLRFEADRVNPGGVSNAGQIATPAGGFVYLLAPNVENSGVITTPSGEAILAAGHSIEIVDSVDPSQRVLVSATVSDVNLSQLMTQSGGNIFAVLNAGRVSANTVVQDASGRIYFKSAGNVTTTATSVVEARGDATLDGGFIQGYALGEGHYQGSFDASGHNGGFIETSGSTLDFAGVSVRAAALAPGGQGGTWLLDPGELLVNTSHAAAISSALSSVGSVLLQTNSSGCSGTGSCNASGSGNIIFDNVSITSAYGGPASLTVDAYGDIVFQGNNSFVNASSSGTFNIMLDAGYGGGPGTAIFSQGTLTFDTTAGSSLVVTLSDTETWTNTGVLNLQGNTQIDLKYGNIATFVNASSGTLNIASNTSGWAFISDPSSQDGVIQNHGTLNVTGTSTAFEARFSNGASGTVNLQSGVTLSLQNADVMSGTFNIGSGSTLWISEVHDGNRTFDGALIDVKSGGTFAYGSPSYSVEVTVTNSTFILDGALDDNFGNGSLFFSDSTLMSGGDLTVPGDSQNVYYSGTWMDFIAGGNITVTSDASDLSDTHDFLGFFAGGRIDVTSGAAIYASDAVILAAPGGINITGESSVVAGNLVGLYAISESSGNAISAYVEHMTPPPTYTDVVNIFNRMQGSGNVVIDGSSVYAEVVHMMGNDIQLTNSGTATANDTLFAMARNDIALNDATLSASLDMLLVAGRSIRLDNNSKIDVGSPLTLYFGFPLLSSGGWFVDGVQGSFGSSVNYGYYSTCALGASCILVNGGPPIPGVNFFAIYGGGLPEEVLGPMYENGMSSFLYDESLYEVESPTGEDFFGNEDEKDKDKNTPQQCSA
jgi:filamentous hemagglutinin family protein